MENMSKICAWIKAKTSGKNVKYGLAIALVGFFGLFTARRLMGLEYEEVWTMLAFIGL